jgi:hypothetical protein
VGVVRVRKGRLTGHEVCWCCVFLVLLINQIHQLFVFRNAAWRGLYRGDDFVVIIDDTMVLITSRSRPR